MQPGAARWRSACGWNPRTCAAARCSTPRPRTSRWSRSTTRAIRPRSGRSLPRRRTRFAGLGRRSCAGTTAWQSGSGSRRSGPAPDVRELAPLGELALADRVADLHEAAAAARRSLAQAEGREHVRASALQPDQLRPAGKAGVEVPSLRRCAEPERMALVDDRPGREVVGGLLIVLSLEGEQPATDHAAVV